VRRHWPRSPGRPRSAREALAAHIDHVDVLCARTSNQRGVKGTHRRGGVLHESDERVIGAVDDAVEQTTLGPIARARSIDGHAASLPARRTTSRARNFEKGSRRLRSTAAVTPRDRPSRFEHQATVRESRAAARKAIAAPIERPRERAGRQAGSIRASRPRGHRPDPDICASSPPKVENFPALAVARESSAATFQPYRFRAPRGMPRSPGSLGKPMKQENVRPSRQAPRRGTTGRQARAVGCLNQIDTTSDSTSPRRGRDPARRDRSNWHHERPCSDLDHRQDEAGERAHGEPTSPSGTSARNCATRPRMRAPVQAGMRVGTPSTCR